MSPATVRYVILSKPNGIQPTQLATNVTLILGRVRPIHAETQTKNQFEFVRRVVLMLRAL